METVEGSGGGSRQALDVEVVASFGGGSKLWRRSGVARKQTLEVARALGPNKLGDGGRLEIRRNALEATEAMKEKAACV